MAGAQTSQFRLTVASHTVSSCKHAVIPPHCASVSSCKSPYLGRSVVVRIKQRKTVVPTLQIRSAAVVENARVRNMVETTAKSLEVEEIASGVWTFTQPLGIASLGLDPREYSDTYLCLIRRFLSAQTAIQRSSKLYQLVFGGRKIG